MVNDLVKLVVAMKAEREAVLAKERALIQGIGPALQALGYRVVQLEPPPEPGASPARTAGQPQPLVCSYCGRTFGRPHHLGRHVSARHRAGKEKKRRR
jgi:hypothetical protein